MSFRSQFTVVVCLLTMCQGLQAATIFIDDFSEGAINYTDVFGAGMFGTNPDTDVLTPGVSSLFSSRTATHTSILNGATTGMLINPSDEFAISNANSTSGVLMTYLHPGGVDMTQIGADRFGFSLISSDGLFDMTFTVEDSSSATSTLTTTIGAVLGTLEYTYASFTGTADFSDLTRISINFENTNVGSTTDDDLRFAFFGAIGEGAAVPEPTTVASLGIGVAMLQLIRVFRRRIE